MDPGDDPREQNQSAGTLQAKPMMTKHTIGVEHITIESTKSFLDVRAALERKKDRSLSPAATVVPTAWGS